MGHRRNAAHRGRSPLISGPHFRDYHLLLDVHAEQLFAMTDPLAE